MTKILIGIDPGVQTGFAVMRDSSIVLLKTITFWDVPGLISEFNDVHRYFNHSLTVYIEDPNLNKPVFNRGQQGRIALNIAQKVGANKRDAELLIDFCKKEGIEVVAVRPQSGPFNKMKAEFFKKQSGWTGRTSQHVRDACGLIMGRS